VFVEQVEVEVMLLESNNYLYYLNRYGWKHVCKHVRMAFTFWLSRRNCVLSVATYEHILSHSTNFQTQRFLNAAIGRNKQALKYPLTYIKIYREKIKLLFSSIDKFWITYSWFSLPPKLVVWFNLSLNTNFPFYFTKYWNFKFNFTRW
jgi:hypothetical protein